MQKKHNHFYLASVIRLEKSLKEVVKKQHFSLWFVLSGEVRYSRVSSQNTLGSNDFILFKENEAFSFTTVATESHLVKFEFSIREIERLLLHPWQPNFDLSKISYLSADSKKEVISLLLKLSLDYFSFHKRQSEIRGLKDFFSLLESLENISEKHNLFTIKPTIRAHTNPIVMRMQEYVERHFQGKISLKEVSQQEFLSEAYMSRLFKEHSGITFSDYIVQIRLQHAENDFTHSQLSLTEVATNNGFPSIKRLNEVFFAKYQMSPRQFMKQQQPKNLIEATPINSRLTEGYYILEEEQALQFVSKFMIDWDISNLEQGHVFPYDLALPKKPTLKLRKTEQLINIGSLKNLEKTDVQTQLECCLSDHFFQYIRFSLPKSTHFNSNFKEVLTSFSLNHSLNIIKKYHLKPILVITISENDSFEILIKQLDFLKQLIQFTTNKYNYGETEWHLEMKPDFTIDEKKVTSLVTDLLTYARKQFDEIKLGLTVSNFGLAEQTSIFSYFTILDQQNLSLDFLSFTLSDEIIKGYSKKTNHLEKLSINSLLQEFEDKRLPLATNTQLDYLISEWGTFAGQEDIVTGSYFRASIIMKEIISLFGKVDVLGFWLNATSNDISLPSTSAATLSLFLFSTIQRPLFFVLQFLKHLDGDILIAKDDLILTQNEKKFTLLYFKADYLDPTESAYANLWKTNQKKIDFNFKNFLPGSYLLKSFLLDKDNGGIYNQWQLTQADIYWDDDLLEFLTRSTVPQLKLHRLITTTGEFREEAYISINACFLLEIIPINS